MGYKDDDDFPEAPPIQMVTETFSQVIVTPEDKSKSNEDKENRD